MRIVETAANVNGLFKNLNMANQQVLNPNLGFSNELPVLNTDPWKKLTCTA